MNSAWQKENGWFRSAMYVTISVMLRLYIPDYFAGRKQISQGRQYLGADITDSDKHQSQSHWSGKCIVTKTSDLCGEPSE
jgi:hypothetical protein